MSDSRAAALPRRRSSLLGIAILTAMAALGHATPALAWKPKTHVYLAELAYKDAVDDGLLTIYATDYQAGVVKRNANGTPAVIGTYRVNPAVLAALRANPAQFRAGVLGPDAYPDIATGQQIIHPAGRRGNGETEADLNRGGPGPDPWLSSLWVVAYGKAGTPADASPACRAFVVGYLAHAAGDIYGHTLINHYTGDAFHFSPRPENAIKHIVLEGYVGLKTPDPTYDARIDQGVAEFIYRNLVDARPGSLLATRLLTGENVKFSVPAVFSELRRALEADIRGYNDRVADYNRRIDRANIFDKVGLGLELAAFTAANGLRIKYSEHWVEDIVDGLKAWPALSHEIALALFYNARRDADLDRVKALIDDYTNRHLLSMLGAPDFVGAGRALVGGWIDAVLNAIRIPALKQAIDAIKASLYDFVLTSAFGMKADELKRYLASPETQFDPVMTNPAFFSEGGNRISRADFDRNELRHSGPTFDHEKVPAAYNTVVLTKLLMMDPAEVNRLMRDVGSDRKLSQPAAVLGFIGTLDGSNQ
jgi:hypothetical protein